MPSSRWIMAAAVLFSIVAAPAAATDRFFRDSFAVSPDGRFRIDAKSPDNAGPIPRPFAASFVYTLRDTSMGKVVWERKQPMTREKGSSYASPQEPSPVAVFVTDHGLVGVRTAWDSLVILDAADGHKRGEADILKAFPTEEHRAFVSETTAGPMWSQKSDWFFLRVPAGEGHAAATYFVIRPYWHHRLVIDAGTATHVDLGRFHSAASEQELSGATPEQQRLLGLILQEEDRRAAEALNGALERLKNDGEYRVRWEVYSALDAIGFLKASESEPELRRLERGLNPSTSDQLEVIARVREALRAIGKVPAPGFGVRLYPRINKGTYTTDDTEHPFNASVPLDARVANAQKVVVGMSAREMTDLIGCPDAALFDDGHSHDYDIDAPEPYTLRVLLDPAGERVIRVKKITPFAFLHDAPRRRGY